MKNSLLHVILIPYFCFAVGFIEAGSDTYYAAGIIPYAIDDTGKVKFLIGASSVHGDQASDFGGLKDLIDNDLPEKTAAREACEELMFILDNNITFKRIVSLREKYKKNFDIGKSGSKCYQFLISALKNNCPYIVNNGYIMHFVLIPYDETIVKKFRKRKNIFKDIVPKCWNETVSLAWVDLDDLLHAIKTKTHIPSIKNGNITLYKPFIKSIKIAHKNGIIPSQIG